VLNGAKTFITNAGIADFYVLVARTGEAPGARGLTAFLIDADTPGLTTEQQHFVAPHAGGTVTLTDCRVPAARLVGAPGGGFKLAMQTFDIFRTSVAAAALGFGRRAIDEAVARVTGRQLFGKPMAEMDGVQSKLAEMVSEIEGAALLTYRAAWAKDTTGGRCTAEVSLAQLVATEAAQRVVDGAVQLFGGAGVTVGSIVEHLYREVRPLRIYEGASEVQRLVIAREVLKGR
jgi:acyl-CoA dehydrogenase